MRLNFALIPEPGFAEKCAALSQEIAAQVTSPYILGENSLPHLSVIQLKDCPLENARQVKNDLPDIFEKSYPVDAGGIQFNHTPKGIGIWINVLKSAALQELQNKLLAHPEISARKNDLHYPGGDQYRPHFSLGIILDAITLPKLDIDLSEDAFKSKAIPCRLHLGHVGPHWQFAEIIE